MSLFQIFQIAGGGMSAQSARLNATASNLANANTVSGTPTDVYREKQPIFETVLLQNSRDSGYGVQVKSIVELDKAGIAKYEPDHPMADETGYVYMPDINLIEQMTNMMSASRSYENTVEMLNTSTQLMMRTLEIGR